MHLQMLELRSSRHDKVPKQKTPKPQERLKDSLREQSHEAKTSVDGFFLWWICWGTPSQVSNGALSQSAEW